MQATILLQRGFGNISREDNPELIKIYSLKHLLIDTHPNFINSDRLNEFVRLYELSGGGDDYPSTEQVFMGIALYKGKSGIRKPDLQEINEAFGMRSRFSDFLLLGAVREALRDKNPEKYAELDIQENTPKERERLQEATKSDPSLYVHEMHADGVTDEQARISLTLKKNGIQEPTPPQVFIAELLITQQRDSDTTGIPLGQITLEHINGIKWFGSDKHKEAIEIQKNFWNNKS